MMGSGKSATGPLLAEYLAYAFVDVDVVIEKVSKRSIATMFEKEGEEEFRRIETQVLNEIGQHHSLVVATGGGVVTRHENWGILHQGIVIWLDPGRECLLERLQADPVKRPLLETQDPVKAFDALLKARQQFYSEADYHVVIENQDPEEVANRVLEGLPSILRKPEDLGAQQTTGV